MMVNGTNHAFHVSRCQREHLRHSAREVAKADNCEEVCEPRKSSCSSHLTDIPNLYHVPVKRGNRVMGVGFAGNADVRTGEVGKGRSGRGWIEAPTKEDGERRASKG